MLFCGFGDSISLVQQYEVQDLFIHVPKGITSVRTSTSKILENSKYYSLMFFHYYSNLFLATAVDVRLSIHMDK